MLADRKTHHHLSHPSPAVGKNKKLSKRGGVRKKAVDPFTRKEWYQLKAPTFFQQRDLGRTPVNRSQGLSECLQRYMEDEERTRSQWGGQSRGRRGRSRATRQASEGGDAIARPFVAVESEQ